MRVVINTLPLEQLTHHLKVEIANNAVFWLNCFPLNSGIHATLSSRTVVTL